MSRPPPDQSYIVGTYHDGNHGYLKLENHALATVMRALLRDYPINTLPLDPDGLWYIDDVSVDIVGHALLAPSTGQSSDERCLQTSVRQGVQDDVAGAQSRGSGLVAWTGHVPSGRSGYGG